MHAPALIRWGQADLCEFKGSLIYTETLWRKTKTEQKNDDSTDTLVAGILFKSKSCKIFYQKENNLRLV